MSHAFVEVVRNLKSVAVLNRQFEKGPSGPFFMSDYQFFLYSHLLFEINDML